ncbi:hypothetical protein QMK11_02795 [Campylobacter jejuni]|nr:hypothetical protein QMK11_02795 [Campylobacter jejuni]
MKLNIEIYPEDLKEINAQELIDFYNNSYHIETNKFLDYLANSSEKMCLLEKILENCSDKEKEEIKKIIEESLY